MPSNPSSDDAAKMAAYVRGELTDDQAEQLDRRIEADPELRKLLEKTRDEFLFDELMELKPQISERRVSHSGGVEWVDPMLNRLHSSEYARLEMPDNWRELKEFRVTARGIRDNRPFVITLIAFRDADGVRFQAEREPNDLLNDLELHALILVQFQFTRYLPVSILDDWPDASPPPFPHKAREVTARDTTSVELAGHSGDQLLPKTVTSGDEYSLHVELERTPFSIELRIETQNPDDRSVDYVALEMRDPRGSGGDVFHRGVIPLARLVNGRLWQSVDLDGPRSSRRGPIEIGIRAVDAQDLDLVDRAGWQHFCARDPAIPLLVRSSNTGSEATWKDHVVRERAMAMNTTWALQFLPKEGPK